MKTFAIVLAVFSAFPLFASERADSGKTQDASPTINPEGPYGAYVGCMNRANRITKGLTLNPNTWDGRSPGPEREPVLFFDPKSKGFFYVTPDTATFDTVPVFEHGGNYSPSYDMSFRRSDGGDSLVSFFVDRDSSEPGSASTTGHLETMQKQRASNPNRPYKEIARPAARVKDAEGVKNVISDILLRRFPTITSQFRSAQRDRRDSKDRIDRFMSDAKTAFCVCVKTKRPEIIRAVEAAAKDIGMDEKEYKKCNGEEPMVSQNLLFDFSIFPKAYAATPSKLFARFERAGVDQLSIADNKVIACSAGKAQSYDIKKSSVHKEKCPAPSTDSTCAQVGSDAKLCVKSGSRIAGVTGAGVVILDSQTNSREVIPALEVQKVAISDSWLAIADTKGISIYQIK